MTRFTRSAFVVCLLLLPSARSQIRVPNRLAKPVFQGKQGRQKTEIRFDPSTGIVTLKLLVQDVNGSFIPNLRRENFVVYEDGQRQTNASVDIEHAPAAIGLLFEHGGRFPSLNQELVDNVSRSGRELLHTLGEHDRIAAWMYADQVKQVADFSDGREALESTLTGLKAPDVSETNLYDALIAMPGLMHPPPGNPAVVLLSSCVDTFSKAKYEDVLAAAGRSSSPIYTISLANPLRMAAEINGSPASKRIDWATAEHRMQEISKASGGRLYSPRSAVELSAAYDDMMENLKVRYVITYRSTAPANSTAPRTVRVELINPATGKPLQIVDENGAPVRATVVLQQTYTPGPAVARPQA
ncbi:MAG: hypothetical protein JWP63_2656 [Candidatus Solibacter sp.]|nr:hypothetical protein [Candidatus Solibacter sp.]